MNTEVRSQVHQALLSRRHAIADDWYKAISRTSFVPLKAVEMRQRLVELTEDFIALLLTEPLDRGQAEGIGASLARFHYLEPEALGGTQEALAQQLIGGLTADQIVELQPRLPALLGRLATGFSRQARELVLAEQEWIHGALVHELRRVKEVLGREFALTEALAAAAAVVSSTLDPDQLLDRILEQVSRVVPRDAANIMLIENGQVHMTRWHGYERFDAEEYVSTLVFHIPEMPTLQKMMESGEPMIISDTATDPGWVHVPEMEWLRSYAAAPIAVRGEVIGFLNMDSATPGFFTQAHAKVLRAFANHAAAAIENAQLYKAAQREISERKRAEEELRNKETTMRALLNAPTEAATLLDVHGIILGANETAANSLRKSVDELVGLCIYDFFPPDLAKSRKAQVDKVFCLGAPVRFEDEREGRFFDHNLYPIFNARREVTQIAVYVRDITHRKQAEERIRAYQERLRSLASQLSLAEEQERRRLATALHDRIAQTLALSKIKLGILQESGSSTDLAESLDEIYKLIEQTIQAARSLIFEISSPILYQFGLEAAVEWLTEQTQKQHGILSEFRDDRQPKPLDEDVQVLLFQAVRELLVNVAKHAQAQSVKVTIRRDDNDVQIIVEDDGVGFDTFPISSQWNRTEGFGLFSIRERLDHLNGQLKIESRPGHGTRVTLAAPLSQDETTAEE